ncbi:hypothetical protein AB0D54_31595 [Streptomyces xanthophaeus]|uniref:hypothetical protein n=1 Tax=Streptomyces xanthophaeus TaxID=67385 RepID=UPI0034303152
MTCLMLARSGDRTGGIAHTAAPMDALASRRARVTPSGVVSSVSHDSAGRRVSLTT